MEKPDACNSTDSCIGDCTSDGVCSRCRFNSDRDRADSTRGRYNCQGHEVSTKATAPTINATASSTTFDGTQDIVVTFTVNGEAGTFHVYTDIPQLEGLGVAGAIEEKISDSEYRITIPAQKLKMLIDAGSIKEDQVVTLSSGYTAEGDGYDPVAFPKVSFTYTTGDNGDNGNGETPEKPENPDPDNGNRR